MAWDFAEMDVLAADGIESERETRFDPDGPRPVWMEQTPRPKALTMLGRAVLQLRLYRGWKQVDVERRTSIDQTTISRLERGERRGLSIRRFAKILDALLVGDVTFEPFEPGGPPTALEVMLGGDRWERAGRAADRRLRRPGRSRTTISTRSLPETEVEDAAATNRPRGRRGATEGRCCRSPKPP
jgi:transcriptional regulator with XRE-family HTH domain